MTFSIYQRWTEHWQRTHANSAPTFDAAKRAARDFASNVANASGNGHGQCTMMIVCDDTRETWVRIFGPGATEWRKSQNARALLLVE